MHIGRAGTPSKMECIFFPPPRFFNSKPPLSIMHNSEGCDADKERTYSDDVLTETNRQRENATRHRREREAALYDDLEETKPIAVADGQVTFCRHFKYLGSNISFSLTDDHDIEQQLTSATQSMGALKSVWDSPHLKIWCKYLLFRAIPMNLLLWGCKAWSLRKSLLDKLEVFLHCNIRQILCVSMFKVKEECIQNEHV